MSINETEKEIENETETENENETEIGIESLKKGKKDVHRVALAVLLDQMTLTKIGKGAKKQSINIKRTGVDQDLDLEIIQGRDLRRDKKIKTAKSNICSHLP